MVGLVGYACLALLTLWRPLARLKCTKWSLLSVFAFVTTDRLEYILYTSDGWSTAGGIKPRCGEGLAGVLDDTGGGFVPFQIDIDHFTLHTRKFSLGLGSF